MAAPAPPDRFVCEPLRELARQLAYAPIERRREQALAAERLHDELDADRNYPWEFIQFRITGHRPAAADNVILVGQAVREDLRHLIDALSRSAPLPVDEHRPAPSAAAVGRRLGVSGKTVLRWRERGLRWRWVRAEGQRRPRIGFTPEALDRFLAEHPEQVQRAATFRQMSLRERRALITRARRIAAACDASLFQVARHLARRTGWAVETIRRMLDHHDRDRPDRAIFPDRPATLSPRDRRLIVRAHGRGVRMRRLQERFRRSATSIYRVIRQETARELLAVRLTWIELPPFARDDAASIYLQADPLTPPPGQPPASPAPPVGLDDLPDWLRPWFNRPVHPDATQRAVLARLNFLKRYASLQRERIDPRDPRQADLDAVIQALDQADVIRRSLVDSLLPTLFATARRHRGETGVEAGGGSLTRQLDMLDRGLDVLLTALEAFDPRSPQTFSHYVTFQLSRAFAVTSSASPARAQARRRRTGERLHARLTALLTPAQPQRRNPASHAEAPPDEA